MNTRLREKLLQDKDLCCLLMTDKEVAELLEIKVRTLQNLVSRGDFSGFFSVSPINGKRFWFRPKVVGVM